MENIYHPRKACLFCSASSFIQVLSDDRTLPLGCFPVNDLTFPCHTIPYNALYCENCGVVQTKYIGNLDLVYGHNFAGICGSTRNNMNIQFAEFILDTPDMNAIIEIGAGNGDVADSILEKNSIPYTIVDPSYWGSTVNRTVVSKYFENLVSSELSSIDTVIMSHVFEHFYNPFEIAQKIASNKTINNILLNWPNLEEFVKGGTYNVLNMEHIFYAENKYIEDIFNMVGFTLKRKVFYNKFAIFYHFVRNDTASSIFPKNQSSLKDIRVFFDHLFNTTRLFNEMLEKHSELPAYIWPCSVHTSFCFMAGLTMSRITNILDNSPDKIGKYQYGLPIQCISFRDTIQSSEEKIVFIVGGQYSSEILDEVRANKQTHLFIL